MLDPSSSEEESDEVLEEERRDLLGVSGGSGPSNSCSPRALPAVSRDSGRQSSLAGGGGPTRPVSPSPSLRSEGREEQERLLREEREKRHRLQLYAFIVRCIAYPFNAKQPTDMARRQQKVSRAAILATPPHPPSLPSPFLSSPRFVLRSGSVRSSSSVIFYLFIYFFEEK
uniref:Uncharacterized protein n=1 Tax=Laticauda laticaudata TaxID=8630 RepID=A0A8C5SX86_LATLA